MQDIALQFFQLLLGSSEIAFSLTRVDFSVAEDIAGGISKNLFLAITFDSSVLRT